MNQDVLTDFRELITRKKQFIFASKSAKTVSYLTYEVEILEKVFELLSNYTQLSHD